MDVAVSVAIAVVVSVVAVVMMGCRGDDGMRSTSRTQFVVVLLVVLLLRRRLRMRNRIGEGGGYKVKHGIQLV